jgi:hypothetical protein
MDMQYALGVNWPPRLQFGRHSSASADLRRASFFPRDLATLGLVGQRFEQKATKETKKAFGWQRTVGPSVPSNAESHADAPSAAASVRRLAPLLRYLRVLLFTICSRQ